MKQGYAARFIKCLFGILVCGTGYYVSVQAVNIGIGAWETLQTGMSIRTGFLYGNCSVLVSIAVLVVDVFLKGKIGFGTILNGLLIGKIVDAWRTWFNFLPPATVLWQGLLYLLAGQIILSVGMILYMKPELGCGPRDTLMVQLGKRFPRANIVIVRFAMDITVFFIGVLLGAPYGWGSVFAIGCNSFIMQGIFRIFGFESRSLTHESLADTVKGIQGGHV